MKKRNITALLALTASIGVATAAPRFVTFEQVCEDTLPMCKAQRPTTATATQQVAHSGDFDLCFYWYDFSTGQYSQTWETSKYLEITPTSGSECEITGFMREFLNPNPDDSSFAVAPLHATYDSAQGTFTLPGNQYLYHYDDGTTSVDLSLIAVTQGVRGLTPDKDQPIVFKRTERGYSVDTSGDVVALFIGAYMESGSYGGLGLCYDGTLYPWNATMVYVVAPNEETAGLPVTCNMQVEMQGSNMKVYNYADFGYTRAVDFTLDSSWCAATATDASLQTLQDLNGNPAEVYGADFAAEGSMLPLKVGGHYELSAMVMRSSEATMLYQNRWGAFFLDSPVGIYSNVNMFIPFDIANPPAEPPVTSDKRIYASVYSTESWNASGSAATGLYTFPLDSYNRTLVKEDEDIDASGGGVMTQDYYMCTKELNFGSWTDVTHSFFDPDTWELRTQTFGLPQGVATDLAYDHTTARIFGCFDADASLGETAGSYMFGVLDEATGLRRGISSIETPWIALGCSRQGELYAVDMNGTLLAVDKVNGVTTTLGQLGFTANRRSSGTFDTESGLFYVAATTESAAGRSTVLYAVDVHTATATRLYDFADGEAVGGMYIPGPLALDAAPAAPSAFAVNFDDPSLSGTATLTLPTTTYCGEPTAETMTYLVRAGGDLFATGQGAPGATLTVPGHVQQDGLYTFTLEVNNAAGAAPRVKVSRWVGHDIPVWESRPEVAYSDGEFIVNWNHPVATQHGGYMDGSLVAYDVIRLPDNVKVADHIAACTWTDAVVMPQGIATYSYRVDMYYRGVPVKSLVSADYQLGNEALPYALDFDDEDSFSHLTIIDANGDNTRWYREYDWWIDALDDLYPAACYPYSSTSDADDWLILPALPFESGRTYTLSFEVSTASDSYPEQLEVMMGAVPSVEGMDNEIMPRTTYLCYDPVQECHSFFVPATGSYHIGFHACSSADGAGLGVRTIRVIDTTPVGIDAVTVPLSASRLYNLQGIPASGSAKGMLIEVNADGKARRIYR